MDGRREEEPCDYEDEDEDEDYVPSDDEAGKDENTDGDESDECSPKQNIDNCSTETKTQKLSDTDMKKKVDEIWADLCKDSSRNKKIPTSEANAKNTVEKPETSAKRESEPVKSVTRVFEFAGEEVKVDADVIVDEKTEKINKMNNGQTEAKSLLPPKRNSSGLGNLLQTLNKKPKLSTLTKTKIDWQSFKKKEGFEDELDQHRRSKDSFVERQAFLQRSDFREFENEKTIREKSRLSK